MSLSITSLGRPLMARPTEQSLIADHHGVICLLQRASVHEPDSAQQMTPRMPCRTSGAAMTKMADSDKTYSVFQGAY